MKKIIKKSGETLVEALVSIMVLMMAGSVASSVIISAIQQSALSEDYLIAQNLAYEAVEAIENIRDTNAMLYPGVKECWMNLSPAPDVYPGDCYLQPNIKASKFYTIDYGKKQDSDIYNHWYLGGESSSVPTTAQLYLKDGRYTHYGDPTLTPTKFSRYIYVEEVDDNQVIFNVTVSWQRGAKENSLVLGNVVLTNN